MADYAIQDAGIITNIHPRKALFQEGTLSDKTRALFNKPANIDIQKSNKQQSKYKSILTRCVRAYFSQVRLYTVFRFIHLTSSIMYFHCILLSNNVKCKITDFHSFTKGSHFYNSFWRAASVNNNLL